MPNRLKGETSPYLLQHQDNPVDWYPWGEEALALAQKLDKPIFLSIGYAACHWCHVMAHESFEDPETAQMMNANFINIKVDREERPDLDTIYMNAVVAMTGQGGWPMSVFLTPDGRPFFGGTYFPPTPRYNIPSFRNVLSSITNAWRTDRDRIEASGAQLYEHIKRELRPETGRSPLNTSGLDQAAMTLAQQYDWSNGGWGQAPKFPQPMVIEYLIRRAVRGDSLAEDLALHAMRSMAQGGMYDVVGGGFHRYSVDNQWLVPHFEKMLYDNAQLAGVYLHGYLLTRDPFFRRVCEETIDFVLREMTHPTGGFYSSLDADSEGEEGRFYVWSYAELLEVISDPADLTLFSTAYTISAEGNFEGNNILQRAKDTPAVADELSLSSADVNRRLDEIKAKLLRVRAGRIRPGTDDKILTSWNGLMLVSLSEGARYLKRGDYLQAARTNARFLLQSLELKNRIYRSWRNGKARYRGYLEDYAALILGLLALYQTDPDPFWFQNAMRLADTMIQRFGDPAGGFFDTGDDHEALLVRPKDIQDNATPSGNALAASALLQLSAFSGDSQIRQLAETALGGVQKLIQRYPTAFGQWCLGLDFATAPVKEVAILWEKETQEIEPFLDPLWAEYRPYHVVAIATSPPPPGSPPLLQNRPLSEGHPTAYVCENFSCLRPTNDPLIFSAQLGSKSQ